MAFPEMDLLAFMEAVFSIMVFASFFNKFLCYEKNIPLIKVVNA